MFKKEFNIFSPLEGACVPLSDVNDPAFSEEMFGRGVAVRPSAGRLVAPADGVISQMFETGHAVTMTTNDAAEVLMHIGLDTVKLKGEHFNAHVKAGDVVKVGDLLIEFDIEKIKLAGYDTITPIVICNTNDYKRIDAQHGTAVAAGDMIMTLRK